MVGPFGALYYRDLWYSRPTESVLTVHYCPLDVWTLLNDSDWVIIDWVMTLFLVVHTVSTHTMTQGPLYLLWPVIVIITVTLLYVWTVISIYKYMRTSISGHMSLGLLHSAPGTIIRPITQWLSTDCTQTCTTTLDKFLQIHWMDSWPCSDSLSICPTKMMAWMRTRVVSLLPLVLVSPSTA